jgi:hypothetical protein
VVILERDEREHCAADLDRDKGSGEPQAVTRERVR